MDLSFLRRELEKEEECITPSPNFLCSCTPDTEKHCNFLSFPENYCGRPCRELHVGTITSPNPQSLTQLEAQEMIDWMNINSYRNYGQIPICGAPSTKLLILFPYCTIAGWEQGAGGSRRVKYASSLGCSYWGGRGTEHVPQSWPEMTLLLWTGWRWAYIPGTMCPSIQGLCWILHKLFDTLR